MNRPRSLFFSFFAVAAVAATAASPGVADASLMVDTTFNSSGAFADHTDALSGTLSGSTDLTVGSNSDRMLVAIIANRARASSGVTVNTLSYGGVDFTPIPAASASSQESFASVHTQMYYLLNPTTATNSTLAYDFSNPGDRERGVGFSVLSIANAAQSAPTLVGVDDNQAAGNASTVSINSVPAGYMLIGGTAIQGTDAAISATTGQTLYGSVAIGSNTNVVNPAYGYEILSSSGTAEMGWSFAASDEFSSVAVAVAPIPEPTALTFLLPTLALFLLRRRRRSVQAL